MIRFQLFGVPDLRADGGTKAFTVLAQPKQVAMLAILCVARDASVRRERLLALLWPDLDETRARNGLSKAIHNCRRSLGDEAIGGRFAEEIALDTAAFTSDKWEFDDAIARGDRETALRIALTGDFLDGLQVPDSAAFEHWLDSERNRIRRFAVESATTLAEHDETSGDLVRAVERLRIAATLTPLDERILRRRITLIDRLGDRAGALEAFADFRLLLQRELDVEPSPETLALVEAMRRRELPPAAPAVASTPERHAPQSEPKALSPTPPVVDDSAEARERNVAPTTTSPVAVPAALNDAMPKASRLRQAAASLLIGVALAGGLYARDRNETATIAPGRVIVAPFVNQTNDSTLTPIGELAADLLAAALARAGVADVADARTRVRKGLSVVSVANGGDVEELADRASRAGYNTVITGRYYRTNGILTVIAQIRSSNAGTPAVRFAEEQGSAADPLPVLRRVEQRLLGAFASMHGSRIPSATTGAAAAPTYPAYVEYVGGLKAWTDDDARTAATRFERVIRLDSSFVSVVPLLYQAWMGTANRSTSAESLLTVFAAKQHLMAPYDQAQLAFITGFNSGDREGMYQATRRMAQLAPHSPDAQWSLGFAAATTNRFDEALQAFKAAEVDRWWTKDKLFASIHWQSISYHLLRRHADELAHVRAIIAQHPFEEDACMYELRAMAPLSAPPELERAINGCIAASGGTDAAWRANATVMVSAELRAHDRPRESAQFAVAALALFRDALKRDSSSRQLREGLAFARMELGQWADALAILEPAARALPDNAPPKFAANAAIVAAKLGRTALADEMLARLSDSTPTPFFHLQRARVLAHRSRTLEAIAELRAATAKGLSATELFHANFGLEPLRRHPAYDALVKPRR